MLSKRIISCLDVRDGKLAKSVKFVDTKDIGDPVVQAKKYYAEGLDELVFYDITASSDKRDIMLDVVSAVAEQVFIPFSVGGGLRTVEDCGFVDGRATGRACPRAGERLRDRDRGWTQADGHRRHRVGEAWRGIGCG